MLEAVKSPRRARPAHTFFLAFLAICALALASTAVAAWTRSSPSSSLGRRGISALEDESAECRKVRDADDQCAWIHKHCVDEDAGLISYLNLYYCQIPHLKPIGFLVIATWAALLFSTIGIAASDFFCVNLSTISSVLGINENMAGVTFLAFGNGSPDVFSTFAAIRSNSGSLAVGELIGAAGFITAVVSGSMALVRPFKVARKSFVRDVSFFAVSVAFSMVFCANGKLEFWECAVMVGFYVFYVIVVVVWHWWLGRRRIRREKQAIARGHFLDSDPAEELDFESERREEDDESQALLRQPSFSRHASLDDFVDLERANAEQDLLDELDDSTKRQQWLGEINSNMRVTQTPIAERRNISGAIRPSLVGALEFQSTLQSLRKSRNIQSIPIHLRRYSDEPTYTLAQQQRNNEAESLVASPETSLSRDPSEQNLPLCRSESEGQSRSRAKSADAAGLLNMLGKPPRPKKLHPTYGLISPRTAPNDPDNPAQRTENGLSAHTPTISISVPEDPESQPLLSNAQDDEQPPSNQHLALPTPSGDPAADDDDASKPERPKLKILTPSSARQSRKQSPRLSPFPALRDRSASPNPPSLVLGPSFTDSDGVTQSPDDIAGKPISWWPYKALAPPQDIFRTLFPTLHMWNDKNIWGKLLGIAASPSFLLLTLTLPVVEPEASAEPPPPATATTNAPATSLSKDRQASTTSTSSRTPRHNRERRNSTAVVAVQTERRHRHSSPIPPVRGSPSPAPAPTQDEAPKHPHAAVISPTTWNRWLVLIQCFTAPYIVLLAAWANFWDADPALLLRPSLFCILGSCLALLITLLTTSATRPPRWHVLLCFAGFAVSVTWISTIANEVVGVLKAIGVIFDISDAILGLTIFAVGNSLGDLVADVTVARLGFPVMALSACFGGPMLNILLGIGLSGLYMTVSGAERRQHKHPDKGLHFKPYHVEVSTTLLISAAALLVTLVGLLVVVPLNGWKMDRKIGWGLIILWVVSTAGNLGVELGGVGKLW